MSQSQSKRPQVPEGWEVLGEFPDVNPATATDEQLDLLTEDLFQARLGASKFVLDIGWHPEADRGGRYTGRLIEADDWENPVEELQTTDRGEILGWAEETMETVSERMGEAAAITDDMILCLVMPVLAMPPDFSTNVEPSGITVPSSVSQSGVQRAQA